MCVSILYARNVMTIIEQNSYLFCSLQKKKKFYKIGILRKLNSPTSAKSTEVVTRIRHGSFQLLKPPTVIVDVFTVFGINSIHFSLSSR